MIGIDCKNIEDLQEFPSDFFRHDVEAVAKTLIGVFLFNVDQDGTLVGGRIVETEAYCQSDPAAHCFGDKRPPSERKPPKYFDSMYLPAGHVYIYKDDSERCYLNITCDAKDYGSAVLIRSIEPCRNSVPAMKCRRLKFIKNLRESDLNQYLCSGPVRLSQALGIRANFDGKPISKTSLKLYKRNDQPPIVCGRRVGVTQGAEKMRRFALEGSAFISERGNKRFPPPIERCVETVAP